MHTSFDFETPILFRYTACKDCCKTLILQQLHDTNRLDITVLARSVSTWTSAYTIGLPTFTCYCSHHEDVFQSYYMEFNSFRGTILNFSCENTGLQEPCTLRLRLTNSSRKGLLKYLSDSQIKLEEKK